MTPAEIRELIRKLRADASVWGTEQAPLYAEAATVLTELLARVEGMGALVQEAYEEGWHEGYATGDAGGSYSASKNDWEGSNARAALSGGE